MFHLNRSHSTKDSLEWRVCVPSLCTNVVACVNSFLGPSVQYLPIGDSTFSPDPILVLCRLQSQNFFCRWRIWIRDCAQLIFIIIILLSRFGLCNVHVPLRSARDCDACRIALHLKGPWIVPARMKTALFERKGTRRLFTQ